MDQNKASFLEIITAGFSAGEVKTFVLAGGYFELIDAAYPVTVRLVDRYGTLRGYMTQAEASFYMRQGDFDAIEITSQNAQSIRFAYGSAEAGTRRTSGVVSIIDGEQARISAGVMFSGALGVGLIAGQFPMAQVWNPLGSGFNLVIKKCSISSPNSQPILIGIDNNEYSSDLTASRVINKKSSGGNTAAKAKVQNLASTPTFKIGYGLNMQANQVFEWIPNGGLIIEPGYGFCAYGGTAGTSFTLNAEWFESAI